jgi:hypothetical protein
MTRLFCFLLGHRPDYFLQEPERETHTRKGFVSRVTLSKPARFLILTSKTGAVAEFDVCERCGEIARVSPPPPSRVTIGFTVALLSLALALAALSRLS